MASSASSICLCGTNRDNTAMRGVADRGGGQGGRRRLVESVAHHCDSPGLHTERCQVARRRKRNGDVLVAAVHPGRQLRLDEPTDPAQHRARHRPLFTVTVMHEHRHSSAERQPGHERQAVLGVDHHIGAPLAQRAEPQASQHHGQSRPDVDGVAPARAADPHAVDDLASRRTLISGGAQRHRHARLGQLGADALEIGLAAAALRVTGIAPAQQQHGANGSGRHRVHPSFCSFMATLRPVPSALRASGSSPAVTDLFARRATLSRSLRLLREFRFEQTRPRPLLRRSGRRHR